jgi:hypothetical protein
MKYTLISFYSEPNSESTYYSEHAKRLKSECEQLEITHLIENIPSRGNYLLNCFFKPQFILDCWEKIENPILWLDVDSSIIRKPNFDYLEKTDFAAVKMKPGYNLPIWAHCLYFNKTENAKRIITNWKKLSEEACLKLDRTYGDHNTLCEALKSIQFTAKPIDQNIFTIKHSQ